MDFVRTLLSRFKKTKAVEVDDVFEVRLRKLQGRNRTAPQASPFRNQRLHPAA